jgi:chromosome segregation protein
LAAELSLAEDAARETGQLMADLAGEIREAEAETEQLQLDLAAILDSIKREQLELAKHEERVLALRATQDRLERDQSRRTRQAADADTRVESCVATRRTTILQVLNSEAAVAALYCRIEEQSVVLRDLEAERTALRGTRTELNQAESRLHRRKREISDVHHQCEIRLQEISHQRKTLTERISEEYQISLDELVAGGASAYQDWLEERQGDDAAEVGESGNDSDDSALVESDMPATESGYDEIRAELEERVQRLRRKRKAMGNVNVDALDSLDELESRFALLSGQLQDLREAQSAVEDIIKRISVESRRLFLESFETIREHFRGLFRKLFGGGEADIVLEDPDDVLECGIDIVARPPGKELRSISLLSGGERTLTAVALLFAMFKSNPSPYCVLDEVDAALDEANVERYASLIKDFVSMTQFIVITHRKRTMAAADVLYGVTMEQAGVSKRMSVKFDDVTENGEFRGQDQAA